MLQFFIEKFYLFFQGAMLFQVVFFGMVYIITRRRDVLYYSLLNLVAAGYFFLNAPETFFDINENLVFNSPAYLYVNFAILLSIIFVYLVFLKEIFSDTLIKYPYLKKVYIITFYAIPTLYILFVLFALLGWKTNPIFYTGHLVNGPFCTLILMLNFKQKGYKSLVISGMLVVFVSVVITMALTIRYNIGSYDTVLDRYPLSIIKLGMLIDIMLFQLALLKRWHYQEKQLAVEKLQSQLKVEKLRNKISGELHDDIGSTLSGIVMYSHMTHSLLQNGDYKKANDSVQVIQKSASEIVHKLCDLVWAINPGKDSFIGMLERTQRYGNEMCMAKDIRFHYSTNINGIIYDPGMEVLQHLYLIAKEAINNAVKYSDAEIIKFEANLINNNLEIIVADNGKGFDEAAIIKGNGIVNMRKRAEKMNTLLSVESANGTIVKLAIKITN